MRRRKEAAWDETRFWWGWNGLSEMMSEVGRSRADDDCGGERQRSLSYK